MFNPLTALSVELSTGDEEWPPYRLRRELRRRGLDPDTLAVEVLDGRRDIESVRRLVEAVPRDGHGPAVPDGGSDRERDRGGEGGL